MRRNTDLLRWLTKCGGVQSVIAAAACFGMVGCQDSAGDRPDRRVGFRPPDNTVGDDLLPPVDNAGLTIEPDPVPAPAPGLSANGGLGQSSVAANQGGGTSGGGRREYESPAWLDEAQKRLQSQSGKGGGESSGKPEVSAKTEASKPSGPPKKSPIYAKKVPGKPGVVWNPFVPGEMLDVSDLPPGAEARDPKTGGTFLVP